MKTLTWQIEGRTVERFYTSESAVLITFTDNTFCLFEEEDIGYEAPSLQMQLASFLGRELCEHFGDHRAALLAVMSDAEICEMWRQQTKFDILVATRQLEDAQRLLKRLEDGK